MLAVNVDTCVFPSISVHVNNPKNKKREGLYCIVVSNCEEHICISHICWSVSFIVARPAVSGNSRLYFPAIFSWAKLRGFVE